MLGFVHSTESFGTVDGPGIRFVVFMQGCPMRCLYCHNPDTWAIGKGDLRSAEDILSEYDGVKEFLKDGGLTVSGGEPLVQTAFVTELFEKAKAKGIHTCLDTSGILFTPENTEMFDRLIKSTDLVLLDIKHIDDERHRKLTGHSNERVLAFAKYLKESGKEPERHLYMQFTCFEEVGHGAASYCPKGVTEMLSVDMGCVGEGLTCTEHMVSICAKDSSGPYNYAVVKGLEEAAIRAKADYAVDIYPSYSSDASVAVCAGFDVRHGVIGPGVYASHGYERSHKDGVCNTLLLLDEYIQ